MKFYIEKAEKPTLLLKNKNIIVYDFKIRREFKID